MLKKVLLVLLICCMLLPSLTACGKKKSKSAQDDIIDSAIDEAADLIGLDDDVKDMIKSSEVDTSDQQPVEADIEIIVDLPEGWEEKEAGANTIKEYEKGTTMVTIMKPWVPGGVNDPKGVAEAEKEVLAESFEGATISDIEDFSIGGLDGARMDIDLTIGGTIKQTQVYVYFKKGNDFYKIMGAYFSNDEEAKSDLFSFLDLIEIK
ncbi:MAG: hypothetical protein GXY12_04065 [Clostridiaceae bacterium]|nr:hypothetical protein [Clostridiaceae bacterium]